MCPNVAAGVRAFSDKYSQLYNSTDDDDYDKYVGLVAILPHTATRRRRRQLHKRRRRFKFTHQLNDNGPGTDGDKSEFREHTLKTDPCIW
jgi:hypothetical protein